MPPDAPAGPAADAPPDSWTRRAAHTARGTAMGLADIVPGVSGGTVALILGIHARLVAAIRSIDVSFVRALPGAATRQGRPQFVAQWRRADAGFLVLLGIGIGIGVLAGSVLVTRAIDEAPAATLAFFFGLIVASVRVPLALVPRFTWREGAAFFVAGGLAFWVTVLDPVQAPTALWFLPIAGAVAICAMILPGISGAFILILIGLYYHLLDAIHDLRIVVLGLFGLGALVGILAFSRVLHRLLTLRPGPTMAALAGLMVGSLGRVWPHKASYPDGANILPSDTTVLVTGAAALAGVLLAWLLERLGETT